MKSIFWSLVCGYFTLPELPISHNEKLAEETFRQLNEAAEEDKGQKTPTHNCKHFTEHLIAGYYFLSKIDQRRVFHYYFLLSCCCCSCPKVKNPNYRTLRADIFLHFVRKTLSTKRWITGRRSSRLLWVQSITLSFVLRKAQRSD